MEFNNLQELLILELKDLCSAENQIIQALPKMITGAASPELRDAFENHLSETKGQVNRLRKCVNILQSDLEGEECRAMKGLVEEGIKLLQEHGKSSLRDAALIGAAQKIEHYEMAAYGTARAHAELLEQDEIVDLLHDSLEEEASANKKLTKIAEGSFFEVGVNKTALESL